MGGPRGGADGAVIKEASDWFALLRGGAATDADLRAFEAWRRADPRHAAAYDRALSIWEDIGAIDELRALADEAMAAPTPRPAAPARAVRVLLSPLPLAVAAAAAAIAAALWLYGTRLPGGVYETGVAEVERVALPDGSLVDLGPGSRLEVAYSAAERRVVLGGGEAFFAVRKGDRRAFVAAAGGAEVRVTGTRFNIHQGPSAVTVSVAEGAVEVRAPAADGDAASDGAVSLGAGERAAAPLGGGTVARIAGAPPESVGAWRAGRLQYADATLREVIADANRYSRAPIAVADEALLDLKLAAAFRADQVDAMIDGLPAILPLEVDRSVAGRIVLRARAAAE